MNSPSISPFESSLRLIWHPTKNAVEQEVGNALSVCHEIWRTIELVVAGLEIGLHF
jgi:hypothetical protein